MKRFDFKSIEELDDTIIGEREVLTVVTEKNWIMCDLVTECKSWKTALRRFFKLIESDKAPFDGMYDCMRGYGEYGLFEKTYRTIYTYKIEALDENLWYIYLIVRI